MSTIAEPVLEIYEDTTGYVYVYDQITTSIASRPSTPAQPCRTLWP